MYYLKHHQRLQVGQHDWLISSLIITSLLNTKHVHIGYRSLLSLCYTEAINETHKLDVIINILARRYERSPSLELHDF